MKIPMVVLALAAGVSFALSGCSSSGGTSTPPAGAPTTGAATVAASTSDPCASVVSAIKQKVTRPEVTKVDATGACTIATIETTLADTDLQTAVDICEAAATVAYTGDNASVAVTGKSGKELAEGVKGEPCIGEP
jgi:hypothetical protein